MNELVCGNCYRRGKNTVLLIKAKWRYRIFKQNSDAWVIMADDVIDIPDDIGQETSFVTMRCARCGNDFFIPKLLIKQKEPQMKMIDGLKVRPVCKNCNNQDGFLFIGLIPYFVENLDNFTVMRRLVDDNTDMTEAGAIKLVKRLLKDEDYTIPIICKDCNSKNIDFIPIKKEESVGQIDFDKAYVSKY